MEKFLQVAKTGLLLAGPVKAVTFGKHLLQVAKVGLQLAGPAKAAAVGEGLLQVAKTGLLLAGPVTGRWERIVAGYRNQTAVDGVDLRWLPWGENSRNWLFDP